MAKTFTTYHGQNVTAQAGETVLLEYRKGFLNGVTRFTLREDAERAKETKVMLDSYSMQKVYHWKIETIKE